MLTGRRRNVLVAIAVLVLSAGAAGCGHKEATRTTAATEGPYLDVGPLQYQVQISRQLNPHDTEDRAYFVGVPNPTGQITPTEVWFAVFVKAFNRTANEQTAAKDFTIVDTVGKRFKPIAVSGDNSFAYRPAFIPSGGQLPAIGSVADDGVIGGSMLLFKIPLDSLANRPLVLIIKSASIPQKQAEVDLDV